MQCRERFKKINRSLYFLRFSQHRLPFCRAASSDVGGMSGPPISIRRNKEKEDRQAGNATGPSRVDLF
jgi:hypothetical protein